MSDDQFKFEEQTIKPLGPHLIRVGKYVLNVQDIVAIVPLREDQHQIVPHYSVVLREGMVSAVKLDAAEWAMMEAWLEKNAEILPKPTKIS